MIRSNCYLTGIILVTIILLTVSSGAAHITYAWSLKYSYLVNMSDVNNGKIVIAVTAAPLMYVASFIGGDRVVVYSLVPAGVDPHHFEPSTSFLVNSLSNATIVLMTGPSHLIIESRISELVREGVVKARIVDYRNYLKHGLNLMTNPKTGKINPHGYLLTYSGLLAAASSLAEVLAVVDPLHENYYYSRLQDFEKLIIKENQSVRKVVPHNVRVILFTPILQYVINELGLKCNGIVLQEPETEFSEAVLKELIDSYKKGLFDVVLITDFMAAKYPKVLELLNLNRIPYVVVPISTLSSTPHLIPAVIATLVNDLKISAFSINYEERQGNTGLFDIGELPATLVISEAILIIVLAIIIVAQRKYIESRVISGE